MKTIKLFILLILIFYISTSAHAKKYIIKASGTSFTPSSLNGVNIDDTIVWQWVSGSHTTTSKDIPVGAESWNSSLNSGNLTFEYKVTTAGTYYYVCTPHESMGMTGSFTVSITTGIDPVPGGKTGNFSVYPNPFREDLYVSIQAEYPLNGELKINTISGKVVALYSFKATEGLNYQFVPTGNIENGTYFLKVYADNKLIATKKIIKY